MTHVTLVTVCTPDPSNRNTSASGHNLSVTESFLRYDLTNDKFLSALGKFAVDDPARLDRLSLANLRENKRARNNVAALHAARTCLFGARQLGNRKWYADRQGIASRLKTQMHRRQFRLGLIANLAFYNKLNICDLLSLLQSGDPSSLACLNATTPTTISALRSIPSRASPYDLLRVIAPERAELINSTVHQISALADYVQSLCGYLACNEALEPAHAVICKLLRTGGDFKREATSNPIHVAAAAIAPLCPQPDIDGVLRKKSSAPPARQSKNYPQGYCFRFQHGKCTFPSCMYKHRCANCHSSKHGKSACQ